MQTLKPCPFCGSKRIIKGCVDNRLLGWGEAHNLMCRRCGVSTKDFATKEEAIEAWNRRIDNE